MRSTPKTYQETAYTDRDRFRRITSEHAIEEEYRRRDMRPVRVNGVLLSPALVDLLQMDEAAAAEGDAA